MIFSLSSNTIVLIVVEPTSNPIFNLSTPNSRLVFYRHKFVSYSLKVWQNSNQYNVITRKYRFRKKTRMFYVKTFSMIPMLNTQTYQNVSSLGDTSSCPEYTRFRFSTQRWTDGKKAMNAKKLISNINTTIVLTHHRSPQKFRYHRLGNVRIKVFPNSPVLIIKNTQANTHCCWIHTE